MLCAVVTGPTFADVHNQVAQAVGVADLVELRVDLFRGVNQDKIRQLQVTFADMPFLLTLRTAKQGGLYQGSDYVNEVLKLAALHPAYLDVEYITSTRDVARIREAYPSVKIVVSYHDFEGMPDLAEVKRCLHALPADVYKVAVKAENSLDALKMLLFVKRAETPMISIAMGELGMPTRILGPLFGSPWTYCALEDGSSVAPGQLTLDVLEDLYHYHKLNRSTRFHCLIGNPIDRSLGHIAHNKVMEELGLDGVYVKIPLLEEHLDQFFVYARELGISGISVTMPLKEKVMGYLDEVDPMAREIGAINTIARRPDGTLYGTNTDGRGALEALEEVSPVGGKRLVMIGAGGAAKAVAYEALRRGALVTIVNRDGAKAQAIADRLKCAWRPLDAMGEIADRGYDIIVNATPNALPIEVAHIRPGTSAMDLRTRPADTDFLVHARQRGCSIVYGQRMWQLQAVYQLNLWFDIGREHTLPILETFQ